MKRKISFLPGETLLGARSDKLYPTRRRRISKPSRESADAIVVCSTEKRRAEYEIWRSVDKFENEAETAEKPARVHSLLQDGEYVGR